MTAPAFEVVRGEMKLVKEAEARPLPSLEDFARFLAEHPGATDTREAMRAQHELLRRYAAVWANFEGVPAGKAQQQADALMDEMTMTSAERDAEANR